MENKLPDASSIIYSATHIDEKQFYTSNIRNFRCINNINYWIDDSEEREQIVEASAISIWRMKRIRLSDFDQRVFEYASLYGSDMRMFLQRTTYPVCWLSKKIMDVLYSVLKDLEVVKSSTPIKTSVGLSPPQIPEWICRAITSIYVDIPVEKLIDDFEMIQAGNHGMDAQSGKQNCPVCSILKFPDRAEKI